VVGDAAGEGRLLVEDPIEDEFRGGRGVRSHEHLEIEQVCELARV
jgi:hypothetical protein